jgi:hypothetical protein
VPEGLDRQQQRCENLRFHVSALIQQTTRPHITEESNLKVTEYTSFADLLKYGQVPRDICFDRQCWYRAAFLFRMSMGFLYVTCMGGLFYVALLRIHVM